MNPLLFFAGLLGILIASAIFYSVTGVGIDVVCRVFGEAAVRLAQRVKPSLNPSDSAVRLVGAVVLVSAAIGALILVPLFLSAGE